MRTEEKEDSMSDRWQPSSPPEVLSIHYTLWNDVEVAYSSLTGQEKPHALNIVPSRIRITQVRDLRKPDAGKKDGWLSGSITFCPKSRDSGRINAQGISYSSTELAYSGLAELLDQSETPFGFIK